jgi:acetate kinase
MIEIIERRILDLARAQKAELRTYLPEGTEAILFVEFQEEDEEQLRHKFREVGERVIHQERLASDLKVAKDNKDMAMLERIAALRPLVDKSRILLQIVQTWRTLL